MEVVKVINLIGAPSSGKTTLAAELFYELKIRNKKVYNIPEFASELVHQGRQYLLKCQPYIFGEGIQRLEAAVNYQYEYIITDSPLLLSAVYDHGYSSSFRQVVIDCFSKYNNYTFFIPIHIEYYSEHGRIHSLEESKQIEEKIKCLLGSCAIHHYSFIDIEDMLEIIL